MVYKKNTAFPEEDMQLARFTNALGHPSRITILKKLSGMSCCFCSDIVERSFDKIPSYEH